MSIALPPPSALQHFTHLTTALGSRPTMPPAKKAKAAPSPAKKAKAGPSGSAVQPAKSAAKSTQLTAEEKSQSAGLTAAEKVQNAAAAKRSAELVSIAAAATAAAKGQQDAFKAECAKAVAAAKAKTADVREEAAGRKAAGTLLNAGKKKGSSTLKDPYGLALLKKEAKAKPKKEAKKDSTRSSHTHMPGGNWGRTWESQTYKLLKKGAATDAHGAPKAVENALRATSGRNVEMVHREAVDSFEKLRVMMPTFSADEQQQMLYTLVMQVGAFH